MRLRSLPLLLFSALAPVAALAEPPGFAFLDVPAGARGSALGGAYASVAQGVESVFWNPAGLEATRGVQLMAGHYEFFQGLRHEQFALGGRLLGGGAAIALRAMYSEGIEERDALGNPLGSFGAHDLDFALGYARAVLPGLHTGASLHVVRERIANAATDTYAFDVGAAWQPARWDGLRVALTAQNLGPAPRYTIDGVPGEPVPLPGAVQGGAAYRLGVGDQWTLLGAAEGRFTRGRAGMAVGGLEIASRAGAALRVGVRGNDAAAAFAAGAGWKAGVVGVDYAFVPYKLDLGDTHRISLSAQF